MEATARSAARTTADSLTALRNMRFAKLPITPARPKTNRDTNLYVVSQSIIFAAQIYDDDQDYAARRLG